MDITIGIIGLGNAGSALAKAFSKKCSVIGYDINPERYNSDNLSTVKLVNSIDELFQQVLSIYRINIRVHMVYCEPLRI